MMYFQKPADSLTANLPPDASGVAIATDSTSAGPTRLPMPAQGRPSTVLPPVPVPTAPPIVPNRAMPAPAVPDLLVAQPKSSTSDKRQLDKITPVPANVTELPPRNKIFLMYDDRNLERAIIDSLKEQLHKELKDARFPDLAPVVPVGTVYQPKTLAYAPGRVIYEPAYLVHRRLHFEEKNAERYGWDLGIIQPVVSAAYFYRDVLLWPNSLASGVRTGFWDTNEGKCLPGSPTPYYLYPPGLTITGTVFETAVATGIAVVVP